MVSVRAHTTSSHKAGDAGPVRKRRDILTGSFVGSNAAWDGGCVTSRASCNSFPMVKMRRGKNTWEVASDE